MATTLCAISSRVALRKSPTDQFQVRHSVVPQIRSVPGIRIECSSRPQKKATAHHIKTRPKKKGYDKRRKGPTQFPRLAERPPAWDVLTPKLSVLLAMGLDHPSRKKPENEAEKKGSEKESVVAEVVPSSAE